MPARLAWATIPELDLCSSSAYFQPGTGISLLGHVIKVPGRSILPMSAESSNNDQPGTASWASQPDDVSQPEGQSPGTWPADPIRTTRSIGALSSFAARSSFARRRPRRPFIVAGIAVAGLLGGAGAALATTGSAAPAAAPSQVAATPAPAPTPAAGVPHRFFGRNFAGAGFGGPAGLAFGGPAGLAFGGPAGVGGALHGQMVVAKPGGGYQTVDIQNGRVTAVSSTAITLKSVDGYSRSYAITGSTIVNAQRDGIGSVKVGNQASVLATVSGSTATAVTVTDITLLQQGRQAFGYPGRIKTSWSGVS
jgi:hypothetical protein